RNRIDLDDQAIHDITRQPIVVRGDVECARKRITLAIQRVESLDLFPAKSGVESAGAGAPRDDQSIGAKSNGILGDVTKIKNQDRILLHVGSGNLRPEFQKLRV